MPFLHIFLIFVCFEKTFTLERFDFRPGLVFGEVKFLPNCHINHVTTSSNQNCDVLIVTIINADQDRRLSIHAENSTVNALPIELRREIFARLKKHTDHHGLYLYLCACKNPDLDSGSCLIAGNWREPLLF